jgi:hypothetical protein
MKMRLSIAFALVLLSLLSQAQLALTGATPVTVNFDGLGTSAAAPLPSGFVISNAGTTGITYLAAGNTTATTAAAGTSGTGALVSNSSGGAYNFGNGATATASDRALGFLATGTYTAPRHLLLAVVNNTSAAVTDLSIAYDVEKYRDGQRAFEWQFYRSTDGTTWTQLPAATVDYTASAGNTVVNPPVTTTQRVTLVGLNLVPGATTYLRWSYVGSGGSTNAQALALDNLVLTPTLGAAPAPTLTVAPRPVPDFGSVYVGSASPSQPLAVSGTNLTAPVTLTPPAGFELRVGDGAFACCAVTLRPVNGTLSPTTVDVRFVPTLVQAYASGVTVSSSDQPAEPVVPVSGTGVAPIAPATVGSTAATAITATTATAGGTVVSDGGGSVTERGVVFGLMPYPTVADSLTVDGAGAGSFSSYLTGLRPGQQYYLRAYATNTEGTVYGELLTFTTPASPLPVELTTFTATWLPAQAAVRLHWATSSEKNSAQFEVERSAKPAGFARLGTVDAAGNSSSPLSYEWRDENLPAEAPTCYYRLRQVDQDGIASYSPVRAVTRDAVGDVVVFPNPVPGGSATLRGARPGAVVTVVDALGRPVCAATTDATGTAVLMLPFGLPGGVYVVRVGNKSLRLAVE